MVPREGGATGAPQPYMKKTLFMIFRAPSTFSRLKRSVKRYPV